MTLHLFISILISYLATFSYASDPSSLQDFCVAVNDTKASVFVNGKICKDPKTVTADDFFFSGLNKPVNSYDVYGLNETPVTVDELPGLNTLGISFGRAGMVPGGVIPLHTHPRASEIIVALEGTLYVGFVTSDPTIPGKKNKLFAKTLHPGDIFVFPEGLIHFSLNIGKTNAVVYVTFSSQNPGFITIAPAVFGSDPPINPDVLTRAFKADKNMIDYLQRQFEVVPDFRANYTN